VRHTIEAEVVRRCLATLALLRGSAQESDIRKCKKDRKVAVCCLARQKEEIQQEVKMLATINRETALSQLDIEHDAVRELIEMLTEEEMIRPDTIKYGLYWDQHLSFKDLMAHLLTYEDLSVGAIEAWQSGERHRAIDEMQSKLSSRRIHYSGIEDRRGMLLSELLEEWERTQANLMNNLRSLSDKDWHCTAPFPTPIPLDLGGVLEIVLVAPPRPPYRHLPVHIPDVHAYIQTLRD
jgi:DinB superfamily